MTSSSLPKSNKHSSFYIPPLFSSTSRPTFSSSIRNRESQVARSIRECERIKIPNDNETVNVQTHINRSLDRVRPNIQRSVNGIIQDDLNKLNVKQGDITYVKNRVEDTVFKSVIDEKANLINQNLKHNDKSTESNYFGSSGSTNSQKSERFGSFLGGQPSNSSSSDKPKCANTNQAQTKFQFSNRSHISSQTKESQWQPTSESASSAQTAAHKGSGDTRPSSRLVHLQNRLRELSANRKTSQAMSSASRNRSSETESDRIASKLTLTRHNDLDQNQNLMNFNFSSNFTNTFKSKQLSNQEVPVFPRLSKSNPLSVIYNTLTGNSCNFLQKNQINSKSTESSDSESDRLFNRYQAQRSKLNSKSNSFYKNKACGSFLTRKGNGAAFSDNNKAQTTFLRSRIGYGGGSSSQSSRYISSGGSSSNNSSIQNLSNRSSYNRPSKLGQYAQNLRLNTYRVNDNNQNDRTRNLRPGQQYNMISQSQNDIIRRHNDPNLESKRLQSTNTESEIKSTPGFFKRFSRFTDANNFKSNFRSSATTPSPINPSLNAIKPASLFNNTRNNNSTESNFKFNSNLRSNSNSPSTTSRFLTSNNRYDKFNLKTIIHDRNLSFKERIYFRFHKIKKDVYDFFSIFRIVCFSILALIIFLLIFDSFGTVDQSPAAFGRQIKYALISATIIFVFGKMSKDKLMECMK